MNLIDDILTFWFGDGAENPNRAFWFKASPAFDAEIRTRYGELLEKAPDSLSGWEVTARGALARILVLDQFPRNLYRGEARAFAWDEAAREATKALLAARFDQELEAQERAFAYMPLMHSESLPDQLLGEQLFLQLKDSLNFHSFAVRHRVIVERFGRFPHRNRALGRSSSAEEEAFLLEPGSSF